MASQSQMGQIVWHDLLTADIATAMGFYAELLGWEYQIEHASNFVWKPGAADYPLILAHGEAHGGFVDGGKDQPSRWLAYVRVKNVDMAVATAQTLGATVDRAPFDVPGVGRNAVIRDPQGAVICPTVPTHNFPPPAGTFLWDE
ncbi:MAG: VOC family protein, partial [Cyanobacteria bacterium J06638_6]